MTPFDFFFSLFGLLLGLSLVEVLSGVAKVIHRRGALRSGLLTPMLALFVMLDVTSFWGAAWRARDAVPVTSASLFTGLLITSLYYLAASLVIPDDAAEREELDSHFFQQKHKVLGLLLLCNILAFAARGALMGAASFAWTPVEQALVTFYFVTLGAAVIAKGRTLNVLLLGLLILSYLADAVQSAVIGR